MKDLKDIVLELQRRKIRFDEGDLITTLWEESCSTLLNQGYQEPLKAEDIVNTMYSRGEAVVKVADALYQEYNKIIDMDFKERLEDGEEDRV